MALAFTRRMLAHAGPARGALPAAWRSDVLLSGLMVTRPATPWPLVAAAIGDFAAQTHRQRELVVVHDGDAAFDARLAGRCAELDVACTLERAPTGEPLGTLRNRGVERARGALVAQWDDDDRHHPQRLAREIEALVAAGADAAFATEQIHWFEARGVAFWEDWQRDRAPLDVVQGTLVARRERLPRYPHVARGEDSALVVALARAGTRIARVRGIGWSYVYRFHGGNAWDFAHHAAAAVAKALPPARLAARERVLRERLAEYAPPLPPITFPAHAATIVLDPASAGR
jgi:glycosyltransferase involved in cell wall biosynthesis